MVTTQCNTIRRYISVSKEVNICIKSPVITTTSSAFASLYKSPNLISDRGDIVVPNRFPRKSRSLEEQRHGCRYLTTTRSSSSTTSSVRPLDSRRIVLYLFLQPAVSRTSLLPHQPKPDTPSPDPARRHPCLAAAEPPLPTGCPPAQPVSNHISPRDTRIARRTYVRGVLYHIDLAFTSIRYSCCIARGTLAAPGRGVQSPP